MTESYFVRKRKLGKTGSVLNEEKETHNEKDVNPSVWKPKPPAPGGGFIVEKDDFEKKLRVEYQKTPVASGRLGRYYEDPPLLPDGTTPGKRRDYAKKWIQEIYERILVLHSNPIVATLRISTLYSLADPNSFISSPDSGIFKTITSIGAKINKLSSVNWDEFEEVEAETAAAEAGSDDEEKDAWDEVQFVYGNSAQSDIEKDELKNIMDQKDKISTDAYYRKLSDFFKEKSRNLEAKIQANNKANAGKKAGGSQHTSTAFTKWKP